MKLENTLRTFSLVLAVAALPCTGCVSASDESIEAIDAPQIESEQHSDAQDEGANVIAEITLAEGATVRFIDQSDAENTSIGMLTTGIPGFAAAVRKLELTPLEVYRALAPELEAPALLVEHHLQRAELQGRVSLEPRQDATALLPGPASVIGTASMTDCMAAVQPGSPTWGDLYCPNIAGGYDACGSGVVSGTQYIQTGVAGENYLGACTPNGSLTFRVERQMTAGVWSLVTQITIASDHHVEYESDDNLLLNYRAKMTPQYSWVNYQWGAARD